ncbi:MAG: ribosome silencing factor [Alistipes sp.]|jgi:ribosome-associated protein|nr:ribosome silencing factor [Alistipes sp.]
MDKVLETVIEAIKDKKGKNIVALDMRKMDGAICSWFVICNADSTTQVGAIAAGVEDEVEKRLGTRVWRVDGAANSLWIAMDYIDVVVHVFQTEMRGFYKLDELWADAPTTKYEYEE